MRPQVLAARPTKAEALISTAERCLWILKLAAALGCGLMAGVFFAFSAFVMSALARLPAPQGLAAMQAINVRVLNPVFLGVFMGTALACLALALSPLRWPQPHAPLVLIGSLLYLVGTFGVTVARNVPLNEALAALKPGDADSARAWAEYIAAWTAWNHVRTLAALAASGAFILGLCRQSP